MTCSSAAVSRRSCSASSARTSSKVRKGSSKTSGGGGGRGTLGTRPRPPARLEELFGDDGHGLRIDLVGVHAALGVGHLVHRPLALGLAGAHGGLAAFPRLGRAGAGPAPAGPRQ